MIWLKIKLIIKKHHDEAKPMYIQENHSKSELPHEILNISLIHYTAHCCFEMLNFKLSKYSLPNFFQFPQYTYVYVNVADFSNKLQNILQNNTKDRDILQTERWSLIGVNS
jgi:hypothetical protein